MIKLFSTLLMLVVGIPVALLRGFVLSTIVWWFLAIHLGVVQSVGIVMIVSMFTFRQKTDYTPADPDPWYRRSVYNMTMSVIHSLVIWGTAYVWHLFL